MRDLQEHLFSGSLTNIVGWAVAFFSVLAALTVSVEVVKAFKVTRRDRERTIRAGELDESQVDNWLKEIRTKYAEDNLKKSS
jgi:hypothetical protein